MLTHQPARWASSHDYTPTCKVGIITCSISEDCSVGTVMLITVREDRRCHMFIEGNIMLYIITVTQPCISTHAHTPKQTHTYTNTQTNVS